MDYYTMQPNWSRYVATIEFIDVWPGSKVTDIPLFPWTVLSANWKIQAPLLIDTREIILKVLLSYLSIETIMEGRDTYIMGWVRKHWGNERLQKIRCKGNPSSCRSSRLYYKVSSVYVWVWERNVGFFGNCSVFCSITNHIQTNTMGPVFF